jgi:hypothetical protein
VTCLLAAKAFPQIAASPPPSPASERYAEVTVDPAHTSAYVATIGFAIPPLQRQGGAYTSEYSVKVFPFFMFNEHGRISIEFSDEQLQRLERGETVDLQGHARSSSGADRRVEGRAVSDSIGGNRGRIKVRVWVSRNIELTFNTAYRFTGKE